MANKRMFNMKIVDSDAFLDLPLSSQCLYFHLNMRADDDGFVSNPKRVQRLIGASDDDLKLLIAKSFILTFENGVIVIKHWRMHNTLSRNRYSETTFIDEKKQLLIKENNAYSFNEGVPIDDTKKLVSSKRRTNDATLTHTDIDLDKDIDIDLDIDKDINISTKKTKHKYGEYKHVLLTEDQYLTLKNEYPNCDELIKYLDEYIEMKGYKAKNHYLAIKKWVVDAVNRDRRQKPNNDNGGLIF